MALRGKTGLGYGGGTTWTLTVSGIGIQLNDIIILFAAPATGTDPAPTWPSGFIPGGTSPITNLVGAGYQAGASWMVTAYKVATASEPTSYGVTWGAGAQNGAMECRVYSGRTANVTTFNTLGSQGTAATPTSFTTAGGTAAAGDDLVCFWGTQGISDNAAGLTPTSGWANPSTYLDAGANFLASTASQDYVNNPGGATGTITAALIDANADTVAWRGMVYALPAAPLGANPADGASTTATVSTGTGGQQMLAVTAGQLIDVYVYAHVVVANTCTCADQLGNIYIQRDRFNNTSVAHDDFYRFSSIVTVPGTPVVTATYGSTPASFNIAAKVSSGIDQVNPFTAGQFAHNVQATASGTDAQTSGSTPALGLQPVLAAVWGFSLGETSAPTAGTGFSQVGSPVWGAPFTGVCCTYEEKVVTSTSPVAGTFTPVDTTHPMYTFTAIYNMAGAVKPPPGPLPRCVYVMP